MRASRSKGGWLGAVASLGVFLIIFGALILGTRNLSGSAGSEGQRALAQAIERAAVLCYATEGFYPPSLSYIEEKYGVQIDEKRYTIRYEVFASNVMPVIQVESW